MRADQLLVERGVAVSRSQALRLIAHGVSWRSAGGAFKPVRKGGEELPENAEFRLEDDAEARYVSRGGLKLEAALRASGWSVQDWRCLDVGQSTGGFTDCLLRHGAREVVGVEVGHGQLAAALQNHPQVRTLEGLNARDLAPLDPRLMAGAGFDLAVGDLSFISLTLVLPAVVAQLKPGGALLMLVKPQFELQPGQLGKGGVVRDPSLYAQVQTRLLRAGEGLGLQALRWHDSPITGGDGNREFFIQAIKPERA
jgi:23S rRNA (cytidine1920-2'-O)/16S rRNA (cytidine1409-2'-O)-methyltransferase